MESPEVSALTVGLDTTVNASAEIKFQARGATVLIPTGSGITSLTYYAAEKPGGTYLPLYASDASTEVTQTVQGGRAYDMPAAVFGAYPIKIVANAAGNVYLTMKG